jgi:hypothetical protein
MNVDTAREWIRYLQQREYLSRGDANALISWLHDPTKYSKWNPAPVIREQRNKSRDYADRMRDEYPELWVTFKTYRRLMTGITTEE